MEKPKIRNTLNNRGKRNRTVGHNYERQLAKEFREILGDKDCRTTRQSSRLLDSCKVDLDCYFLNIQAKNVRSNINYVELHNQISEELNKHLPKRADLPIAIFHKKQKQEYVVLTKETFYGFAKLYKDYIDGLL